MVTGILDVAGPRELEAYSSIDVPIEEYIASRTSRSNINTQIKKTISIHLHGRIAPNYYLRRPLILTIEYDDGSFIVSDDIFLVYGDDESIYLALDDYVISLVDYYQLLSIRAEEDPPTQRLFNQVQEFIIHQDS
jgi:hypothetical protein